MSVIDVMARTGALLAAVEVDGEPGRSHVDEILARFDEVDARLVAAGFPPTSPWWRETFERWYRSGCRQLVARCGRRGGKSSSLSRLGVVEALYGQHTVPPGDVGTVAIVSTRRDEAAKRLRTVTAILDALGIAYRPLSGGALGVELVGRRVAFQVFAASIAGVSGFTAVFVFCDEVAKWLDSDTGANPATEVLASVRPTMATQANARIVLSSSPMGMLDAHYDAFEAGDDAYQVTAYAPTWEANPTLTEADTRLLERDESTWLREYAAVPQAEVESALLTEMLVDRATRAEPLDLPRQAGHYYAATIDPATRGNAWTLAVATRGPDRVRRVVLCREWRGTVACPLVPSDIFTEIRELLKPYGLTWLTSDQYAGDALKDIARKCGLTLSLEPWTQSNKREAYEGLRSMLLDEELELPPDHAVKMDLLGIRKKLTRNGVTYELATQGPRHSDYAPAIALAALKVRGIAKPPPPDPQTPDEEQAERKRKLIEGLRKDLDREARFGRLPVTHRRR
jgi:hypothetical protein